MRCRKSGYRRGRSWKTGGGRSFVTIREGQVRLTGGLESQKVRKSHLNRQVALSGTFAYRSSKLRLVVTGAQARVLDKQPSEKSTVFIPHPVGHWKAIDPTLDRRTYETFLKPAGVSWQIDWDGATDMLLYSESVAGPPREFNQIDDALKNHLDSYFLFKHEPRFLCDLWVGMGNKTMWHKARMK